MPVGHNKRMFLYFMIVHDQLTKIDLAYRTYTYISDTLWRIILRFICSHMWWDRWQWLSTQHTGRVVVIEGKQNTPRPISTNYIFNFRCERTHTHTVYMFVCEIYNLQFSSIGGGGWSGVVRRSWLLLGLVCVESIRIHFHSFSFSITRNPELCGCKNLR